MAAQQLRMKEDKRLAEFAQEPGMTHVKKPKMASLVQDGVIDLKRVRCWLRSRADRISHLQASRFSAFLRLCGYTYAVMAELAKAPPVVGCRACMHPRGPSAPGPSRLLADTTHPMAGWHPVVHRDARQQASHCECTPGCSRSCRSLLPRPACRACCMCQRCCNTLHAPSDARAAPAVASGRRAR